MRLYTQPSSLFFGCVARVPARFQRWRRQCACAATSAVEEHFEAFLQQHPLPGTASQQASSRRGCHSILDGPNRQQQRQQQPAHAVYRFSWQQAPAVAAHCLQHHEAQQLQWHVRPRGLLVAIASSASSSAGGGFSEAVLRLQLPRAVAGLFPELEQVLQPSDSPLPRPASAQHDAALGVLLSLAQHAAAQPAGSGSSSFQLGTQLLVLLSADSVALGLLQEGCLTQHKVLTGYTVRRKQGKAQLTYERQGGGAHSVGGSIRSREARRLFATAAAKLQEWGPAIAACNQLYCGGGVRAWNELYAAAGISGGGRAALVARSDPRWREVGVGVRRPRLADLERVCAALTWGQLEEEGEAVEESWG